MDLRELTHYLDDYLRVAVVGDARDALNGLQVDRSRPEVFRVAVAVDVCQATIEMAAHHRAELLLVHHGLFWGGLRPMTGPLYGRLSSLLRHDIALYAAHLPLDLHPEVGNNVVLARRLDVDVRGTFGDAAGQAIGLWGEIDESRDRLADRLASSLGAAPPRVLGFGPERVRRVGIVTGAGGGFIPQAAAAGLDTFITGEGPHWSFFDAEELRVNVLYAGHYATETVGVQALGAHLESRYGLAWHFLDHPTGL